MKKAISGLIVVFGAVILSGCSTPRAQPVTSSGEKIHIDVLCDRGDPKTMESKQWGYRNEVGAFLEPNLVLRLSDYGFDSAQITTESEFKHQPDSYLLKVKMVSYNPGSSVARHLVGFGAGAASLDCHYDLIDSNDKVVMSWDDGVGTSGKWQRIAVTLNKNTSAKVLESCTKTAM